MEAGTPDGSGMCLFEGVSNRAVNEVPQLNAVVATSGNQMRANWMEINSTKPVFMALSGHNVFLCLHVPDLPGAVVGDGRQNLFAHVKGKGTDWAAMSVDFGVRREACSDRLVRAREEGVGPRIFRVGSVLGNTSSQSRLTKGVLLAVLCTHPLAFMTLFNLLLDISLVLLDRCLDGMCTLLELILLKFKKSLFLLFDKELLLHFIDPLLERPVVFLDLLDGRADGYLLVIDSGLVTFMEVSLLAEFVPGRLCLLGLDLGLLELLTHLLDLKRKSCILVGDISDETNAVILERSFLLQLVPLLLESVHGLLHREALKEVADEVVNDNVSL